MLVVPFLISGISVSIVTAQYSSNKWQQRESVKETAKKLASKIPIATPKGNLGYSAQQEKSTKKTFQDDRVEFPKTTAEKAGRKGQYGNFSDQSSLQYGKAAQEAAGKAEILTELTYPFKVLERKLDLKHSIGRGAAERFLELMKKGAWYEASQQYHIADWNLLFRNSAPYRRQADVYLDQSPNIDVSVLGFGWRLEYNILRHNFYTRRAITMNELRNGARMSPEMILKSIQDPRLVDPRPNCVKVLDVGEVLAEAGRFEEALEVVKASCHGTVNLDQIAALLGGFSVGLEHTLTPQNKFEAQKVLSFVNNYLCTEYKESRDLQVALSSLRESMKRALSGAFPRPAPFERAILKFPYFRNWRDIEYASDVEASEILWQSRKEFVDFLPIIEQIYRKKIGKHTMSFYTYARLLSQYYIRRRDTWLAYRWSNEAVFSRPNEQDDEWMKQMKLNIQKIGAIESYNHIDSVPGQNAFKQLAIDLENWNGRHPTFTPLLTKHFGPLDEAIKAVRESYRGREQGKEYSWKRVRHDHAKSYTNREYWTSQMITKPPPIMEYGSFSNTGVKKLFNVYGGGNIDSKYKLPGKHVHKDPDIPKTSESGKKSASDKRLESKSHIGRDKPIYSVTSSTKTPNTSRDLDSVAPKSYGSKLSQLISMFGGGKPTEDHKPHNDHAQKDSEAPKSPFNRLSQLINFFGGGIVR